MCSCALSFNASSHINKKKNTCRKVNCHKLILPNFLENRGRFQNCNSNSRLEDFNGNKLDVKSTLESRFQP